MVNRTRVALAGETLHFDLSVCIPANTTNKLKLYHTQSSRTIWSRELKSEFFETTKLETARIKMHNSSSSGNYYFSYTDQKVYLVIHVRGEYSDHWSSRIGPTFYLLHEWNTLVTYANFLVTAFVSIRICMNLEILEKACEFGHVT